LKKENFGYSESGEEETRYCMDCHFVYEADYGPLFCHIFQEEIDEFNHCSLWQELDPEAAPL